MAAQRKQAAAPLNSFRTLCIAKLPIHVEKMMPPPLNLPWMLFQVSSSTILPKLLGSYLKSNQNIESTQDQNIFDAFESCSSVC